MKDYFYRFNFFALLKWVLVLFAALVALKHSKKAEFKNWCKNFRPLRKVRLLIFFASILGLTELYCKHRFHQEMRQINKFGNDHRESNEVQFLND